MGDKSKDSKPKKGNIFRIFLKNIIIYQYFFKGSSKKKNISITEEKITAELANKSPESMFIQNLINTSPYAQNLSTIKKITQNL